ncbi:MAG: DUF6452 family protein [Paludibacter sp.]|nr:DUF6452 family protein [Paludibacter sp.]
MTKKIVSLFLLLLVFYLSSCTNDEECRKNRYVNLELGIYHVTYNATTETSTKTSLSIDSITINGVKEINGISIIIDSIFYNNEKGVSELTLALDKSTNQSVFLAQFNNVTDTLTILYTPYDYYLSLECGCIKTFSIDTVLTTNNFIDSIKITNHNVTNVDAEHIQIYK